MKYYHIKPEHLTEWGTETTTDTIIDSEVLARLAHAWDKTEEELLEGLEEIPCSDLEFLERYLEIAPADLIIG